MAKVISNIAKPPPKWFRIMNRIWSPTENTVLLTLLALGYTEQSVYMVIFKIASGYFRSLLDAILVENQAE